MVDQMKIWSMGVPEIENRENKGEEIINEMIQEYF